MTPLLQWDLWVQSVHLKDQLVLLVLSHQSQKLLLHPLHQLLLLDLQIHEGQLDLQAQGLLRFQVAHLDQLAQVGLSVQGVLEALSALFPLQVPLDLQHLLVLGVQSGL